MMRSLYAGVSGLRSHQTRMDVIGNNIANVNTVGFKSSRVTFKDVFYQTLSSPSTPSNEDPARGGTNPYSIGIGTQVASIDVLNTRAGFQTTDRPYDCYIDGEGYFKVQDPSGVEYYTRVGNFGFDALGQLVDGNGNFVMGTLGEEEVESGFEDAVPIAIDPEEWANYTQVKIGTDGVITGLNLEEQTIDRLGQIALYKFINNDALSQEGSTYLRPTNNSGEPIACAPGLDGSGKLQTSGLEMSNVDLSKEFTDMIVTQRGFQANSRIITVSDEMLQELVNLKR